MNSPMMPEPSSQIDVAEASSRSGFHMSPPISWGDPGPKTKEEVREIADRAAALAAGPPRVIVDGHGHVRPNASGTKARCGGPGMCRTCAQELLELKAEEATEKQDPQNPGGERELHAHRGSALND